MLASERELCYNTMFKMTINRLGSTCTIGYIAPTCKVSVIIA